MIKKILIIFTVLIFILMSTFVVLMEFHALQRDKFYEATQEKIWVSEQPLMWFNSGLGQVEYNGEISYFESHHGFGNDLQIYFCSDVYDDELGCNTYSSRNEVFYGAGKYIASDNKMIFTTGERFAPEKSSFFEQYDSIEFISYTKEEIAEKYPQFEVMTREEYQQKNWPERYPEAEIYKLLIDSLWMCEEPLMWMKDYCGQIELDGEIIDVYCSDGIPYFEIRTLTDRYNISVQNEIAYLLSGADIYQHRTSGEIIVTPISEYEYPLSQYKQMIFKEISEEEFANKYPQFNLFTLEEYEKENKVGNYRE